MLYSFSWVFSVFREKRKPIALCLSPQYGREIRYLMKAMAQQITPPPFGSGERKLVIWIRANRMREQPVLSGREGGMARYHQE
ncbi:hypothetical protein [Rhizobium wenxiniae]|uniref:hypothetical protein n=1 Tax=Rhizobium wenxiniae TaxID=1737357 RepID=UPI003C2661DD